MSRRSVEDWRRMLYRTRVTVVNGEHVQLSPAVRLGLVYLSDFMKANRTVSRPRKLIARDLGMSERSVTNLISKAHDARLLDTVVHGQKGVTAVYIGVFPNPFSGKVGVPSENGQTLPPDRPFSGNPGVPTTESNHPLPETRETTP